MNNPFSATPLLVATASIGSTSILLQTYSQAISNQPEVALDAVPAFNVDQKSVQRSALFCLNEVTPSLVALSAQDIGYANQFNQMYAQLLSDAQVIEDATAEPTARQTATLDFSAGLQTLISTIANGQMIRNSNARILTELKDLVVSNQTNLDADLVVAQKQLLDGDIKTLQAQLASIQQAIDTDNQTIASGAVYGVVAGIKIGVGILVGWYKDPAKGFQMVVGEIQGIVTESKKHSGALADLQTQNQAYLTTITNLLYDEAVYAVVQNLAFNTDLLAAHTQGASLALQSYTDGWNILSGGLTDIYNTLQKGPTASLQLVNSLQSAQSEWNDLLNQAKRMQVMGIVPFSLDTLN